MKRLLLGAAYSIIEPLGLLHLAGLARDLGWSRKIVLVKNHDFEPLYAAVHEYRPDVIGFNVYTGNHLQTFEAFKRIRVDYPGIRLVLGGPHATYFPMDAVAVADDVVISEGFGALTAILNGGAHGIFPLVKTMRFPLPDRETFYADHPNHAKSYIKSAITMTGCPYSCKYCYNSSEPSDIKDGLPPDVYAEIVKTKGMGGRLFPTNVRTVDDVIAEGREIAERWPTKVIYFQDDVHGFDVKPGGWMSQLAARWMKEVGIPYHAQMRWEMVNPKTEGRRRLDLIQEAGCFGLTLAIEAADPVIRKEVLDRGMPEELMFDGMRELSKRGLKVRTEQITGLPYGATTKPTKMNLDADLELVELNVRLRSESGGPAMAWASTLAPYKRTKIGSYCEDFGHYVGTNNDVPDTFFDRSVLRFPKEWVGPRLSGVKGDPGVWLSEAELERYRDQNAELRNIFNFVTLVPDGHVLARSYLEGQPYTFARLGAMTIAHLETHRTDPVALALLWRIRAIRAKLPDELCELAPFFGCLSKGELAAERFVRYAQQDGVNRRTLSTATRHHLYDAVLYNAER